MRGDFQSGLVLGLLGSVITRLDREGLGRSNLISIIERGITNQRCRLGFRVYRV